MSAPRWLMKVLSSLNPRAGLQRAMFAYMRFCPVCNLALLLLWLRFRFPALNFDRNLARRITVLCTNISLQPSSYPRLLARGSSKTASIAAILALANLVALPLSTSAAKADVAGAMDGYFNDMGAAANVTGPSAFHGQSAGYYSGGNVWTRYPQKNTTIGSLSLPHVSAGCGGIDLFAGSFSFINSKQLISLMKSIANNAIGFAFKLAIDTVCPECGKIMDDLKQAEQLMNNQSINSCQMAAGLVGSVWSHSDIADKEICQQFGNATGVFSDMAASMAGCGNGGSRTSTLKTAAATPEFKDVARVPRNYTWYMMSKSAFFSPGGTVDEQLAEYVMTIAGTIIYVPPADTTNDAASAGSYTVHQGDVSSTLVTALLDGTAASGPVKILVCDETTACLKPDFKDMPISTANSVRTKVKALIDGMASNMQTDTALTPQQIALLQVASLPLYKILAVQAAAGRGQAIEDSDTLAEITSIDLVTSILDQMMSEVGKTKSSMDIAEKDNMAKWQENFVSTRAQLAQRQSNTQAKVSALMQVIQKTAFLESTLAAQMSPAMSASVEWSRSMSTHGMN